MPRKPVPAQPDRTPQARLREGRLHGLVGYQLAQAAIVTDAVFDEQMRPGGLRQVELTMLALILDNPGVTARQLARALAVTPPNVTVWLDRLEMRGLVGRTRSETDGRVQHLRLTEAGTALVQDGTQRLLDGERQAMAELTPPEHAMLLQLLHKLALARRRSDPG